MPKENSKLKCEVKYLGPSSKKIEPRTLSMKWGRDYLEYKKNRPVKLYFKKVVNWEAEAGGYQGKMIDPKRPPQIVLSTRKGKNKTEERRFIFKHGDEKFETWLYWIIRSLMLYSEAPIPDAYLAGLSPRHKTRVITRRGRREFDSAHSVFVSVLEHIGKGPAFWDQHRKKFPDGLRINGHKPERRAEGGTIYSKFGQKIGSGGSGMGLHEIYRLIKPLTAQDPTGGLSVPVVVKFLTYYDTLDMSYTDDQMKLFIREARVMAVLGKHENIVELIDVQATEKCLFVFMEKGDMDLSDYTKPEGAPHRLTPRVIRSYARGILSGICHMHEKQVYHLDMKPENVIVCGPNRIPKIIDFGLSKARALHKKKDMLDETWKNIGTMGYMPPESWDEGFYRDDIHLVQRDLYAVGMTLIQGLLAPYYRWPKLYGQLGTTEVKVHAENRINHYLGIVQQGKWREQLMADGLQSLADAACSMIQAKPENRLPAKQALEILRTDWQQRRRAKGQTQKWGIGV